MTPVALDRRTPPKGDARRARLLEALDQLLRDGTLEAVNVADIAERAGVSRTAFYFYFDNKGVAVAALAEQMYDEAAGHAVALLERTGTPQERVEQLVRGLVGSYLEYRHLYRAMLEARGLNDDVRRLWAVAIDSFVEPLVVVIDAERAAGRAPRTPTSRALASQLLDLNDIALQRISHDDDPLPVGERVDAVVAIWLRSIYGVVPLAASPEEVHP